LTSIYLSYFILVNLLVCCIGIIYWVILKKLMFYHWNRFYILIGILVSFTFPFINLPEREMNNSNPFTQLLHQFPVINIYNQTAPHNNVYSIISFIFLLVTVLLLLIFFTKLISLIGIMRKSVAKPYGQYKVRVVNKQITPFSFLTTIFLPSELENEEKQMIVEHEQAHIKSLHSLDVLLFEVIQSLLWYNPVIWFLRKDALQNLEYIADHAVLKKNFNRQSYQLCLLKIGSSFTLRLPVTSFSSSGIRKRIIKMNHRERKPASYHIVHFLILPAIFMLSVAYVVKAQTAGTIYITKNYASPMENDSLHWRARADGEISIMINSENGASISGKNGFAEVKNINKLRLADYQEARLFINNHEYSLNDYSNYVMKGKSKITYIYLGSTALEKYNSVNPIIIVEYTN
jgi:beta-lactamase regulating signal transducer with metallopeptidase domain